MKVEGLLANSGELDLSEIGGPTGYGLYTVEEGVKRYQTRNGRDVDGWMRPGGPTIAKMREQLGSLLSGYPASTQEQVDQHHRLCAKGKDGLQNVDLPSISLKGNPCLPPLFRFLNTKFIQSDIRDTIVARATPRGYVTFSRLHTLRHHALAKAKGHPFEATIHYSFGDFVWGIANAWIDFLDAAEVDLGIEWLVEDPRPRLRKIRDRAALLRHTIAAQEMDIPKDWGTKG